MNVHPGLTTHPKYLAYKRAMGAPDALEYLLRLWGHCQDRRRGENWGAVDAAYVESICLWNGEPGKLWNCLSQPFLKKPGWLHLTKRNQVVVSGWNEHNEGLLANWRNGDKGGRPRVNPPRTGDKPAANPRVNPPRTGDKPTANLSGWDGNGSDGKGGGTAPLPDDSDQDFPEAETPSLEEVLTACKMRNIPEQTGREFWNHYENTAFPKWTTGGVNPRRFQWRGRLQAWSVENRGNPRGKKPGEGGMATEEKTRLRAELERPDTTAERRQEIRKLLEQTNT